MESIAHPFDAAAPEYDSYFSHRYLGRWLREMVWSHLEPHFRAGDEILELNCGTGEDALWLAQRGVHVTATDASTAMLEIARHKAEVAGVAENVTFVPLDLNNFDTCLPEIAGRHYDGVLSNFGGLNCIEDRRAVARALADLVRPGGVVVLVPMGPLCPWEIGWHLAHGDLHTAFRRFRSGIDAHVGGGEHARVWYPTPRRLRREFAPHFRHLQTVGIGILLPPSYLDHLVESRPGLFERAARLDKRLGQFFPWTWFNDHYLTILEAKGSVAE